MRVLFDECLPRRLTRLLGNHECVTVPEMGWAGKSNGELLRLAEPGFDAFLTTDRNLTFQQNMSGFQIAVIVIVASSNRLESLEPLLPRVSEALARSVPGQVQFVA